MKKERSCSIGLSSLRAQHPPDCCVWKTFRVLEGCHRAQSEDRVTPVQQKWPQDRISAKSISKCGGNSLSDLSTPELKGRRWKDGRNGAL